MFILKKIIEPFLLPPGIFILPLLFLSIWLFLLKKPRMAGIHLLLATALWVLSTAPIAALLMQGLESDFHIPANPKGDVIVLLGGGMIPAVPDLSGTGFPNGDMLGRIVTTARLQKKTDLPIIISSGKVLKNTAAGAPVDKRILIDLGVEPGDILIDEKSRDTYENALYTKAICKKMGFSAPILVTSAFHLKRSVYAFRKQGLPVIPFPAYRYSADGQPIHWHSFLPRHYHLSTSATAFREYLAILLYKISY